MRSPRIVLAVLIAVAATTAVADAPRSVDPVKNRVLDLLDVVVELDSDTGPAAWESATFDTSQYTWIGLQQSSAATNAAILCRPAWQFTAQDPFFMTWPVGSVLGDDPAPRPSYPTRVVPTTEVFGLRAKIVCALAFADFGEPEPPRASGTLSDIKVLLRRW